MHWRASLTAAVAAMLVSSMAIGPGGVPHAHASTRYLDPTFNVDVQTDVIYGSAINVDGVVKTLTLDISTPRGDTATNRPVFIWAHGGFFAFGDKSDDDGWGARLAQRGYVVASINYRLSSTLVTAPVTTVRAQQEIDDAREDMQTAVRWFRAHAASLRIDPDRIAVGGYSAGAVTALGVGVNNDDPLVTQYSGVSSAVCTVVSYSGANDPSLVDAGDAGAIFHHGVDDNIVPYAMAVQTRDAMIAAGLPVEWNEYAGVGHVFTDAAFAAADPLTIQWLYDRVATAPYPCSPAVALRPRLLPGVTTALHGTAGRSAIVSLVAVNAPVPGYEQVLPCGTTPGAVSNLDVDAAAQTRSALAVASFDTSGAACVFTQPQSHLVVDLQGYFSAAAFDDVADQRILDTRAGVVPADGAQTRIHGRPGTTAVATVTMTNTRGPGYVQVLPCGATPGAASNLNADAAHQTRAALAFIHFDDSGDACLFSQRSTDLIVDVLGSMAPGAFDETPEARLVDTRTAPPPAAGSMTPIHGPAGATGVVSITATNTGLPGYIQVLPCGSTPGASSNLNTDAAGQTIAGLAFVHFDDAGTACIYNQQRTDFVIDLHGTMAPGSFDDVADVRLVDTRSR